MRPLHVYARLFLAAQSRPERAEVFSQAVEWLENASDTTLSDGLKGRLFAVLCSPEGEQFLLWATGNDGSR